MRNAYNILVGKSERKRPPRRHTRRWVLNIGMDLKIGWKGVEWIQLTQDRDQWQAFVSTVTNLRVTEMAGYFLTS
jgi:hypothetical protein